MSAVCSTASPAVRTADLTLREAVGMLRDAGMPRSPMTSSKP
jgi:hypothetical protein